MLFLSDMKKMSVGIVLCLMISGLIHPHALTQEEMIKKIVVEEIREQNKKADETIMDVFDGLPTITAAQRVAIAVTLAILFRFFSKSPSNEPARISWSEVREFLMHPTRLIAALKSDFKGTMAKLWYAVDDLIIGRPYGSSATKTDAESGKTHIKNSGKPLGIIGYVHAYSKPTIKALAATVGIGFLLDSNLRKGVAKLKLSYLAPLLIAFGIAAK
jgi:hypothetical protein